MSSDYQDIQVTLSDGVAEITLNRPERKNAITGPLVAGFTAALDTLTADAACRAILLRGAGGAFSSGLDLKEFNADPRPAWAPGFGASWHGLHRKLFECSKPVVCALERYAINAGAALAFSADFMIAGRGAFLQVGEVHQGRPAPMNLAWLRFRFGDAMTRRVILLGRRLSGEELVQMGLAFEAVDDDAVLERARALATELAAIPPSGIAATKAALRSLDLPGAPNDWFGLAASAVAGAVPTGPLSSLKR